MSVYDLMHAITAITAVAAIYTFAQSVRDFRRKRLTWAIAGGGLSAALVWVALSQYVIPIEGSLISIVDPNQSS